MFTEDQINQMRMELENPELIKERIKKEKQVNKFIKSTKEMFKKDGRDFDKEFNEYLENKKEV